jgi:hypothetical protein
MPLAVPNGASLCLKGILNYQGNNTLAVALWAMEPEIDILPRLSLAIRGIYDGGVKVNTHLL